MVEMHQLIKNARTESGLSAKNFAALTNMKPTHLDAIESGYLTPSTQDIDTVARALGIEIADLMQGQFASNLLFFRSMRQDVVLEDILSANDGLVLGDFLRAVGRMKRLREQLDDHLPEPAWRHALAPVPLSNEPPHVQGERLATCARAFFGLEEGAIASMRHLLSAQGVEVFFLVPGQVQTPIDGACTLNPAPAMLINPLYEGAPWSLRATMAHELCHLLFDRFTEGETFLISPARRARKSRQGVQQWHLFDTYLDLEKRANAFAAHFLAPLESVKSCVKKSGHPPVSGEAAGSVSTTFGISYETSVNLLWRAYNLTHETRDHLLRLPRDHDSTFPYDELPAERGLFEGQLRALALRAYASGRLSAVEVRRCLEIPMDAALPTSPYVSLSDAQRAPLITPQQRALKQAYRHLIRLDPTGVLAPEEATVTDLGWEIAVVRRDVDGFTRSGRLLLSHDFEPIHDRLIQ